MTQAPPPAERAAFTPTGLDEACDIEAELLSHPPEPQAWASAYGSWEQVVRSHAERAGDPRWISQVVVARRQRQVLGMMTLLQSRAGSLPDANLRQALDAAAPQVLAAQGAGDLLFLGGHALLRGGAVIRADNDPAQVDAALVVLLRKALAEAASRQALPVALYVPHEQVPAMVFGWQPGVRLFAGGDQSVLRMHGAASMEDFLSHCDTDARRTWLRDGRKMDSLGIKADEVTVSAELIAAASPLIAAVKTRNGLFDNARLTRFRLEQWLGIHASRALAWTWTDPSGELAAVALAELHGSQLTMFDVGISSTHPQRSTLYYAVGFHAPLRYALARGLQSIHFGSGHSLPKRIRGATQTLQWHLISGS